MTTRKPNDLATLDDLGTIAVLLRKEFGDIADAGAMLLDDDPTNNGAAALEILESACSIGSKLAIVAAGTIYALQSFGVL